MPARRCKIVTVVGARPQFIKAAPTSRALREVADEVLVHTGQHYDPGMSDVFFRELRIPAPAHHLGVGSGPHGAQTGAMLAKIEQVLVAERPDRLLVYGDTNSTLAGALAAAKLHIPVAHVEAGLRSFDRRMPEELNRVLTDHLADLLFAPTETAVAHLAAEGITRGVHMVGDVMADAVREHAELASGDADPLPRLGLAPGGYYLATLHRAENTDDPATLARMIGALAGLPRPVVLPLHPRTRARAEAQGLSLDGALRVLPPVGYLEMLALTRGAARVLTDSGGLQKEAYLLGVPVVTLRTTTEWTEMVEAGWNVLVGSDAGAIAREAAKEGHPAEHPDFYGDGHAATRIAEVLAQASC